MDNMEAQIAALDQRAKSNTYRLDKLEQATDTLNRLATSLEVMATKQDQIADTVTRLDNKVTAIEAKPGKRWDELTGKIIWAVVAAVVAFCLARIGLQ